MSVIIEIKNYSWQYLNTQQPALQEINLQIEEGMFVGIIGSNGSGKTTLAYSLNGLVPGQYNGIKHGEVLVYGKEVEEYGRGVVRVIAKAPITWPSRISGIARIARIPPCFCASR